VGLTLQTDKWQFWIDRGGTFTDIVAKTPDGQLLTKKLLSENPEAYDDAALHGIREFLALPENAAIPYQLIENIKMGTTVATNALLERKGDATVLAITAGLGDIIEIGYQARPKTFELDIQKPALLHSEVIEISERLYATGEIEQPLDIVAARHSFCQAYKQGYRSIAIVLMHAFKYPQHEKTLMKLAAEAGFKQISASHDVSPLSKIVARGETTIVDAYLTPILRRYVEQISAALGTHKQPGQLLFMQSSGGLVDAHKFRGRDAILSGPAGGIVGAVHTAKLAGFNKIIGFDMGGTSTDVSHYAGEFEKVYETEVAGVRMRVPMMYIHTVAAGGGSLLQFDGQRFRVGPDSAGANPGPVCYRRGGKLAVTDINVCLGKIQADYFPQIFGLKQDQPLDRQASLRAFEQIALQLDDGRSAEDVAEGFLEIAVEHMAQAIKKISVSRGYDVQDYTMNCFGGAGGQHACLVAERLGINTIFLHPLSGVLSAYGMGLADIKTERQAVLELELASTGLALLLETIDKLTVANCKDLAEQGLRAEQLKHTSTALLRYKGTDTNIQIPVAAADEMQQAFEANHQRQFGFIAPEKTIILEIITVESFGGRDEHQEECFTAVVNEQADVEAQREIYAKGQWLQTPVYKIESLRFGHVIQGPAIIIESTGTIIVEQHWEARLNQYAHLILHNKKQRQTANVCREGADTTATEPSATDPIAAEPITADPITADPITLEVFNNLFMSIAEQMGIVLQNTSQSVNVKERLDFSCAVFDRHGNLVANAPHVPVHLGSMDSSVKVIINGDQEICPGDVFVQNNPYKGGSHLPDITVISPVFNEDQSQVNFYLASRAHHEDVGGIAPGSMSPLGTTIEEEGIVFDGEKLVEKGVFQSDRIRKIFSSGPYPARNIEQNIADLMAQTAANAVGATELKKLVLHYGLNTVYAYMGFIQDSAEESVRKVIDGLQDGAFSYELDSAAVINLQIKINHVKRSAKIDFSGTSEQQATNFNAPGAITRAAVLYVFRCLVNDDIPLNAGCMKPLEVIVPKGSMLNPNYPAAVVAGNVETSQAVTNALFAALGKLGSSQGTMNNLTFGNERYQYYETICSGSPAGPGFDGVAAVHTHMTNTRMTDPEIMEQRYPILLEEFCIDRNSGGLGQWNAGDGITRRIRFLENMQCSILSGHRKLAPYGLMGGESGRIGQNMIIRSDGSIEDLGGCGHSEVRAGDTISIVSPTGGGFGAVVDKIVK
jgi:5-oxoprolinase (ATP-hydrolysing)